jgi:hAT family C-terminal dimerisation region
VEKAAQEAEDQACDLHTVWNDLHRYKEKPPPPDNVPFDLVRYWNVSFCVCYLGCCAELKWKDSETIHPLVLKVALDVLPVQASAVPCERVFSSSKETCVLRRSLLSAGMLEVLQVLKHHYKEERLDFISHWIANEDDYLIEMATEAAINELVSSAKCDELLDLLHSMDNNRQQ